MGNAPLELLDFKPRRALHKFIRPHTFVFETIKYQEVPLTKHKRGRTARNTTHLEWLTRKSVAACTATPVGISQVNQ